jgi:hypothetical protein
MRSMTRPLTAVLDILNDSHGETSNDAVSRVFSEGIDPEAVIHGLAAVAFILGRLLEESTGVPAKERLDEIGRAMKAEAGFPDEPS